MDICITPAPLSGRLSAIPSKSDAHRMLIAAALSDRPCRIFCPSDAEDIRATLRCLSSLGAEIVREEDGMICITPVLIKRPEVHLPCGESGATLRFLLPVAAALYPSASFSGEGRLPFRPHLPLIRQMEDHGAVFSSETLPFSVTHMTRGGDFSLPGHISSQFLSGLLLAAPLFPEGAKISLSSPLVSAGYAEMTLSALARFSVPVFRTDHSFLVPPGSGYRAPEQPLFPEGDWSGAAFWLTAGALSGAVRCTGLNPSSPQGDRKILSLLSRMGAHACMTEQDEAISLKASSLSAIRVDVSDIPDLVPILAVAAAAAEGETILYGAGHLRLKESDRITGTVSMLRSLGGDAEELPDGLNVRGHTRLRGGTVNGQGDHRLIMAAAIAACICDAPVFIPHAEAVGKSYPEFFKNYQKLGGIVHVL